MQTCEDCGTTEGNIGQVMMADGRARCTPCLTIYLDKLGLTPHKAVDECTECIHYMRDHKHLGNWVVQCTICDCRYEANRTATAIDNVGRSYSCNTCGAAFFSRTPHRDMYNDILVYCTPCWEKQASDLVSHPSHYTSDPSGVECIQITRHRNFNIGNAIKYLWRAGLKDTTPHVQDLKKAIWYINDEIERLQTK